MTTPKKHTCAKCGGYKTESNIVSAPKAAVKTDAGTNEYEVRQSAANRASALYEKHSGLGGTPANLQNIAIDQAAVSISTSEPAIDNTLLVRAANSLKLSAPTKKTDAAERERLRRVATKHDHDVATKQRPVPLTQDERGALVDIIASTDGDSIASLVKRSDSYLATLGLGSMRRQDEAAKRADEAAERKAKETAVREVIARAKPGNASAREDDLKFALAMRTRGNAGKKGEK